MGRLKNSKEITAAIDLVVAELREGHTPDSRTRKTMLRLRIAMNSNGFQAYHFRDFILPLTRKSFFTAHKQPTSYYLLNLVEDALMHPNCPSDVLKKVCMSEDTTSSRYRKAAMGNANCPEEASVYAALSCSKERDPHSVIMFNGTNGGGPR